MGVCVVFFSGSGVSSTEVWMLKVWPVTEMAASVFLKLPAWLNDFSLESVRSSCLGLCDPELRI